MHERGSICGARRSEVERAALRELPEEHRRVRSARKREREPWIAVVERHVEVASEQDRPPSTRRVKVAGEREVAGLDPGVGENLALYLAGLTVSEVRLRADEGR